MCMMNLACSGEKLGGGARVRVVGNGRQECGYIASEALFRIRWQS